MAMKAISLPSRPRPANAGKRALLYFICGNPGLIGFYDVFLKSLRVSLDARDDREDAAGTAYDIYGRNLLGFDDDEHEAFDGRTSRPWDLEGQIEGIYQDVADQRVELEGGQTRPYDFVILMGHSVGAYICVEMMARHMKSPELAPHLNLRHSFLFFPTIEHIAKSPQGKLAQFLRSIPTVETHGRIYAKCLVAPFPPPILKLFLVHVAGFSAQTAGVTARWLKSRDGIHQALHLAKAEFDDICEETWSKDVWEKMETNISDTEEQEEKEEDEPSMPKFFIFFGKNDHWVSSRIRDIFIKRRKGGRNRIEVDEGNMPHAFCIQEYTSWLVAKKAQEWIEQIEGEAGKME